MIVKVLGIKDVNYTSKKTGQPVRGTELHVCYDDRNVLGDSVDKFYCSSRVPVDHVSVGDVCNVLFDRFGHVDFVEVTQAK